MFTNIMNPIFDQFPYAFRIYPNFLFLWRSDSTTIYVSQLLRVEPSARASSLPANGWRPASRSGPGATRVVVTFIPFLLWAGSTRRDQKGGSCCFVLRPLEGDRHAGAL